MYKDLKKLSDSLRINGSADEASAVLKIARDYAGTDAASCEDFEFEDEGYRWKYVCIPFGFKFQLLKNLATNTDLSGKNIFFEEGSRAYKSLTSRRHDWVGQAVKPLPSNDTISHSPGDYPVWQENQPPGTEWPAPEDIVSEPAPRPRAKTRRRPLRRGPDFNRLASSYENTKNIILLNIPGHQGGTKVAIEDGGEDLWRSLSVRDKLPSRKAFYVLITEDRECYRSQRSILFMIGEDEANEMFHVSWKLVDLVSGSRNSLRRYLRGLSELPNGGAALMSQSQMVDQIYAKIKDARTPARRLPFFERLRCSKEQRLNEEVRERSKRERDRGR